MAANDDRESLVNWDAISATAEVIGADSKLAALFMKGLETPDDLNNDEATQ
ncbi:MAG: hypothetical protein Cons2KO_02370 [Congregibacter sp.]